MTESYAVFHQSPLTLSQLGALLNRLIVIAGKRDFLLQTISLNARRL